MEHSDKSTLASDPGLLGPPPPNQAAIAVVLETLHTHIGPQVHMSSFYKVRLGHTYWVASFFFFPHLIYLRGYSTLAHRSLLHSFYLSIFLLFRAAFAAHGGYQASSLIEATPLAYATATATQDPSHVCDLHHSSQQRWILNPMSEVKDQTCVLMDTAEPQWELLKLTILNFTLYPSGWKSLPSSLSLLLG